MDHQVVLEIATLATVFGALWTAIYTSPENVPYSIWDLLLSAGIIMFCIVFHADLQKSPLFLTLARAALSIACMLAVMTLIEAFIPNMVKKINRRILRILDGQFLIAAVIFGVSFLVY